MCPDGLVVPERNIWANGVPLADADYSFAPQDLQVEYDEFFKPSPKLSGKDRPVKPAKIMPDSSEDLVLAMAKNVQQFFEIMAIPSKMRWDMQNRLLRSLGEGKFVAYGYKLTRNPADPRVKIPSDLFQHKFINWENSTIQGSGLEFVSVLVFESGLAQEIDAHLAKKPPTQGTSIKRGPPPLSDAIEEAIRSLINDRTLPNHNQQKDNIGLVRARAHELHPGEFPHNRGLSNESIRVVLAKLIPRAIK